MELEQKNCIQVNIGMEPKLAIPILSVPVLTYKCTRTKILRELEECMQKRMSNVEREYEVLNGPARVPMKINIVLINILV